MKELLFRVVNLCRNATHRECVWDDNTTDRHITGSGARKIVDTVNPSKTTALAELSRNLLITVRGI
jgi:hypothetical protein